MAFAFLLSGCSILPGMQNIDTSNMNVQASPHLMEVKPIVKPITASYLIEHPPKPYVYHVAPQDVLSITVWNHTEFNSHDQQMINSPLLATQSAGAPGYLINHDGTIYFPLVGYISVAGLSADQVRSLVTKRLSFYVRKPQVLVRVADFRSKKVYIMGEVLKAGYLPLNDQPLSITAALNMSGSLDPNASDPRHIYVIRGDFTRPEIYWLNASTPAALLLGERFQLKDNDVLVVSTAVVTRWNRFLNQLLPSLQTIWYTKAITGK